MTTPPAAPHGAPSALHLRCLLLVLLAASSLAAAQTPPPTTDDFGLNEPVPLTDDTEPSAVNANPSSTPRQSRPDPNYPTVFFSEEPLPLNTSPAPPAPPCATETTDPGSPSGQRPFRSSSAPGNLTTATEDSSDGVGALAICPNNPTLSQSGNSRFASLCRAYLNTRGPDPRFDYFRRCSGTFIATNRFLLAGHCVAPGGTGKYDVIKKQGRYGTVCCAPSPSDDPDRCARDAQFNIANFVSTRGWVDNGNDNFDGAVLKLSRQTRTAPGFGVPIRWGSIATQNPCIKRPFEWAGFPSASTKMSGCDQRWRARLWFTDTSQRTNPCPKNGREIQLVGNICPGMSGGPLVNRVDSYIVGVISSGSAKCSSNKRGYVLFAQIVLDSKLQGVYVQGLLKALP